MSGIFRMERRMDAQVKNPRPWLVRAAVFVLAVVLAVGLWQAYGAWLFSAAASHVL
jgi:hypothetical protein